LVDLWRFFVRNMFLNKPQNKYFLFQSTQRTWEQITKDNGMNTVPLTDLCTNLAQFIWVQIIDTKKVTNKNCPTFVFQYWVVKRDSCRVAEPTPVT